MPGVSPISGWPIPLDTDALGDIGEIIRDLVDGIESGWTAFVPTWTGSVTNPVLGNGSFTGSKYKKIGKTIFARIVLTIGSTTTVGSGTYSFGLPAASVVPAAGARPVGQAFMRDTSASSNTTRIAAITTAGVMQLFDMAAPAVAITHAVPYAWATGDTIEADFVYEAA